MIYKYTSVKRVIAKVFTDLDLQEDTHPVSDMVNWCGEALEKIGSFPQFINKVTGKDDVPLMEFENYQARLPFDFHRLIQVAYSSGSDGPFYALRRATGSFELTRDNTESTSTDPEVVASTNSLVILAMSLYELTYAQALAKINNEPSTASILRGLLKNNAGSTGSNSTSTTGDYVYTINDNYIKLNIETGYLMLAYQAIPTDADGYPLIPDDQSFIDALYWYVTMKILYPKWATGQVRDAVYYDARRSWNYYCKQAYGNAMMPDSDQMESIKNTWLRLVPSINAHKSFYSTIGEQEVIWNSNSI
jgi:hypothetical protein